jgi:tryptophan aminotransferase
MVLCSLFIKILCSAESCWTFVLSTPNFSVGPSDWSAPFYKLTLLNAMSSLPSDFYEPYLSELAKSRRPNPSECIQNSIGTIGELTKFTKILRHPYPLQVRGLYHLEERPGMISMLAGKPNADTFPFTSFSFTANDPTSYRSISDPVEPPDSIVPNSAPKTNAPGQLHITIPPTQLAAALQYGPTSGLPDLISWVYTLQAAQHSRHKGEGWRVCIGGGSQDLLYKVSTALDELRSFQLETGGFEERKGRLGDVGTLEIGRRVC